MLTPAELRPLLADLESDRIERTMSTSDTDKFSRAVCAFANDMPNHRKPGLLIVGAADSGAIGGLKISDQLLQNLAALRSDGNILPLPALQVYRVSFPEGEVAVVEVQPSDLPPVRYKGRIAIRVGPRRADANEQEERILSERRSVLVATWDVHPVRAAPLSELSLRLFSDYRIASLPAEIVAANNRSIEELLASFRFFDLQRGVATVAGVLLFGLNPRFHLPGAYVQFLRFPGSSMSDLPVDQAEIDGDLPSVIRELHVRVRSHNSVGMAHGEGFKDELFPDYPEWVLRELLHNALMHRDYASNTPVRVSWFADRIEIQNPGGVLSPVTRETLTRRNAYRNPTIAEAVKQLGFVNRFGFGIQQVERLLAVNRNPPPEFDVDDYVFGVTVRRSSR